MKKLLVLCIFVFTLNSCASIYVNSTANPGISNDTKQEMIKTEKRMKRDLREYTQKEKNRIKSIRKQQKKNSHR